MFGNHSHSDRGEGGGAIELCLFAPYNKAVSLVSSWNKWQPEDMKRGADGWWRITANLPDGEHFYKFRVLSNSFFAAGQWVEVFDPYGMSITDDEHQRTFLQVKDGRRAWTDYRWKHDDVPLPTNDRLVLYELHVGDFTGGPGDKGSRRGKGKFAGVITKLDYLADLGVTGIELMPVKEFPAKSWGYNLRSLFAVDSGYGPPAELCRLVDECHARKMRVIIDGVYNHAEADSPLAKIDYEYWFYKDNPDPANMQWGPKYNYTHFDENLNVFPARKYIIESIKFWIEHFHLDGIRFDATRAINDFKIMREFTDAAFEMIDGRKPFFTVAEHIPEDGAIIGYPTRGPMVAAWHDRFANHLTALAIGQEFAGSQPFDIDALETAMNPATNGYGNCNHVVNYVDSHDRVRILRELAERSKIFAEAAFRRVKLVMGLLLTSPGLPMLWMGDEFGEATPKTLDPTPLEWALLDGKDNKDLHKYIRHLIKIRRATAALWSDHFQTVLKDGNRHLFAFKRWNDDGSVAIVAANLADTPAGEIVIANAGLEDGVWHESVFDYDATVEGGTLKDKLEPSEVKVFVRKPTKPAKPTK